MITFHNLPNLERRCAIATRVHYRRY